MSNPAIKLLTSANPKDFSRVSVGCIVLSHDKKILLQERDADCATFPGRISTFGGGLEGNETPLAALQRELKEELGAIVFPNQPVALGMLIEPDTQFRELIHGYFWQDKENSVTGCYEGKLKIFSSIEAVLAHPLLMSDISWLIEECQRRQLL